MTEQIAALDALIEAVETGKIDDDSFCPLFHAKGLCREAVNAFNGSLDAAKALASLLSEVGVPTQAIGAILAHTNTKTTEIYTVAANRRALADLAMVEMRGFTL